MLYLRVLCDLCVIFPSRRNLSIAARVSSQAQDLEDLRGVSLLGLARDCPGECEHVRYRDVEFAWNFGAEIQPR